MSAFMHKDRVQRCYGVKLGDTFDTDTFSILRMEAEKSSVPIEFMVPPLITACSHFLNKAEINPWGNWFQPSIIYSATVGFTGTNKTAAMDCIRERINEVESASGLSEMSSKINQSATVESLLKQLHSSDDHRQIQLWDELRTWQSSLGLYKTGAASDYDTTIYLTAYNGGCLKRQTCNSNISVRKPTLNLCGMAHSGEICKALDEERKNAYNNDGLYSRFLICMPEPEFLDADPSEKEMPNLPSLAKVFYVMDQMHKNKRKYTYRENAKVEAVNFYNEQQEYLRGNHSTDTYISGVIGKLKGHAHRLAMIIQGLEDSCKVLNRCNGMHVGPLNQEFIEILKQFLKENEMPEITFISLENTKRAIALSRYFLQHKKYLSGYNLNGDVESATVSQLAKKILLQLGTSVPCNVITRKPGTMPIKLRLK